MSISKKYEISFELNENEKIVFSLNNSIKTIYPFEEQFVIFISRRKKYKLTYDCFQHNVQILSALLKKAISNKLPLHESINEDIGYIANKYMHHDNDPGIFYIKNSEGNNTWVGASYWLYSTPGNIKPNIESWLYNEINGDIIFKITPSYPWHFRNPRKNEKYISYEEFMKNYQPILTRVIPKKVAQKWLKKAQRLLPILDDNYRRIAERYKAQQPKE